MQKSFVILQSFLKFPPTGFCCHTDGLCLSDKSFLFTGKGTKRCPFSWDIRWYYCHSLLFSLPVLSLSLSAHSLHGKKRNVSFITVTASITLTAVHYLSGKKGNVSFITIPASITLTSLFQPPPCLCIFLLVAFNFLLDFLYLLIPSSFMLLLSFDPCGFWSCPSRGIYFRCE